MRTREGEVWEFNTSLRGYVGEDHTVELNGDHLDTMVAPWAEFRLCKDNCQSFEDIRPFDACHFESVLRKDRHTVTFDGGRIELYVNIGRGGLGTEPALFWYAAGDLDGEEFVQEDYYRLVYSPEHHHFSRHFAVLFDTPVQDACGIKAEHLEPYPVPPLPRLTTIRCDLSEIEERTVQEETWESLP
jgi:hypothetical protein